jgi:hypothetical protein
MITVVLIGLFVQAFFLDLLFQKQLWLFLAIAFGLEASRRVDVVAAEGLAARARKALRAPGLTPQRPRPPQWRGT